MSTIAHPIRAVAVVDDSPHEAQVMGEVLRDAGYEPVTIKPEGRSMNDFARTVRDQAHAALCDHRLKYSSNLYPFYGAELVAQLTTDAFPAILVTEFLMDTDVSIRKWRHAIPILLKRDDADEKRIRDGFDYCLQELRGYPSTARRAHRALVRVIDLSRETDEEVIDGEIPSWNPNQAVRFPKSLLGDLQHKAVPGTLFFAHVNTGADSPEELFLRDFELAPEPDPDDGLE